METVEALQHLGSALITLMYVNFNIYSTAFSPISYDENQTELTFIVHIVRRNGSVDLHLQTADSFFLSAFYFIVQHFFF